VTWRQGGTAQRGRKFCRRIAARNTKIGYKATLARIDFTAALFRIERPFANIDPSDNVFQDQRGADQQGTSNCRPLGKSLRVSPSTAASRCSMPGLRTPPLASTNDKIYVGAPKIKGNTLFEYQIPAVAWFGRDS